MKTDIANLQRDLAAISKAIAESVPIEEIKQ
jgi:hypothetical protein